MVGGEAEARSAIDPTGQVFMRGHPLVGAARRRRAARSRLGDRVTVEAVDGLTLVVRPASQSWPQSEQPNEGAS